MWCCLHARVFPIQRTSKVNQLPAEAQLLCAQQVLLIAMLAPRSYTREDVIELHTHGGGVCASRALQACLEAGARSARPGEFTLRAFLNGRLDLSQASAETVTAAALMVKLKGEEPLGLSSEVMGGHVTYM
jgi:tRNA U34 5-carboxymethylaminomethyl modifying GTPase MnmE/TrmE